MVMRMLEWLDISNLQRQICLLTPLFARLSAGASSASARGIARRVDRNGACRAANQRVDVELRQVIAKFESEQRQRRDGSRDGDQVGRQSAAHARQQLRYAQAADDVRRLAGGARAAARQR